MEENEILYWEVEAHTNNTFYLSQEGGKIISPKLTKSQVEQFCGKILKRASQHDNPDIIVCAKVEVGQTKHYDYRSFRGKTFRCYMIKNDK